MHFEILR